MYNAWYYRLPDYLHSRVHLLPKCRWKEPPRRGTASHGHSCLRSFGFYRRSLVHWLSRFDYLVQTQGLSDVLTHIGEMSRRLRGVLIYLHFLLLGLFLFLLLLVFVSEVSTAITGIQRIALVLSLSLHLLGFLFNHFLMWYLYSDCGCGYEHGNWSWLLVEYCTR